MSSTVDSETGRSVAASARFAHQDAKHQDVIAVFLDGSVAQLRRQGLIGLIPIKRVVSDQDLIDARQLRAFEPDAGVPVGVVMRYRARNMGQQGVFGGVLGM